MTIVYNQENSGVLNPYYARSNESGNAWSAPAPVRSSVEQLLQAIFVYSNGGTAHAFWRTGSGIYHAAENQWPGDDNTVRFNADPDYQFFRPDADFGSDGRLHVVWAEGANLQNIFHAYSTNGGDAWTVSPALATFTEQSAAPAVAIDASGNVHVVWEELLIVGNPPTIRNEVHYRKGTRSGDAYSWSGITSLSTSLSTAKRPAITTDGNVIHVGFSTDVEVGKNVLQAPYYRSFSGGSWSAAVDVSSGNPVYVNAASPFFLVPTLATCDGTVYYYYHGADSANGKEKILGVHRPSASSPWSVVESATDGVTRAVSPSVVCDGGQLHLAFEEIQVGVTAHQIYYTSNRFTTYLPTLLK